MDYIKHASALISDIMTPILSDYIHKVYTNPQDFLENPEDKNPTLVNFQHALRRVPNMTSSQIRLFVTEIQKTCPWFENLKNSLFVAYVKMISSAIKTSSEQQRINIKPPDTEAFVHQCFTLVAEKFYYKPAIMKETDEEKREAEITDRIKYCIAKTIQDFIPMNEILSVYITDGIPDGGQAPLMDKLEEPEASTAADVGTDSPITESPFDATKTIETGTEGEKELFPDAPEKHPEEEKKLVE